MRILPLYETTKDKDGNVIATRIISLGIFPDIAEVKNDQFVEPTTHSEKQDSQPDSVSEE